MPLAIVIYIDGSFIKHSIPVKPIYITVRNLDSSVSGKAMAWRVLGMLPGFKKSATPNESDEWRRQRRLEKQEERGFIFCQSCPYWEAKEGVAFQIGQIRR